MDNVHIFTVLRILNRGIHEQISAFVEVDCSFHIIVVQGFSNQSSGIDFSRCEEVKVTDSELFEALHATPLCVDIIAQDQANKH